MWVRSVRFPSNKILLWGLRILGAETLKNHRWPVFGRTELGPCWEGAGCGTASFKPHLAPLGGSKFKWWISSFLFLGKSLLADHGPEINFLGWVLLCCMLSRCPTSIFVLQYSGGRENGSNVRFYEIKLSKITAGQPWLPMQWDPLGNVGALPLHPLHPLWPPK